MPRKSIHDLPLVESGRLKPPPGLPGRACRLYALLMEMKPASEWRNADFPLAAAYASAAADLERLTKEIEKEGEVVVNTRGTPVVNPKIFIRGMRERTVSSMLTKLRLTPQSRSNSTAATRTDKRAEKHLRVEQTLEDDDDDLLAGRSLN